MDTIPEDEVCLPSEQEQEQYSEEEECIQVHDILNLFLQYYKQLYHLNQKTHMFEGIDYQKEISTNRSMELLYEEIHKYQNSNEDYRQVISHDQVHKQQELMKRLKECHVLHLNGTPSWYSGSLLCLLKHLSILSLKTKDRWEIFPLKRNYDQEA